MMAISIIFRTSVHTSSYSCNRTVTFIMDAQCLFIYLFFMAEEDVGLSVGAARIAGQDRSMWRTLRPSAGQAQQ